MMAVVPKYASSPITFIASADLIRSQLFYRTVLDNLNTNMAMSTATPALLTSPSSSPPFRIACLTHLARDEIQSIMHFLSSAEILLFSQSSRRFRADADFTSVWKYINHSNEPQLIEYSDSSFLPAESLTPQITASLLRHRSNRVLIRVSAIESLPSLVQSALSTPHLRRLDFIYTRDFVQKLKSQWVKSSEEPTMLRKRREAAEFRIGGLILQSAHQIESFTETLLYDPYQQPLRKERLMGVNLMSHLHTLRVCLANEENFSYADSSLPVIAECTHLTSLHLRAAPFCTREAFVTFFVDLKSQLSHLELSSFCFEGDGEDLLAGHDSDDDDDGMRAPVPREDIQRAFADSVALSTLATLDVEELGVIDRLMECLHHLPGLQLLRCIRGCSATKESLISLLARTADTTKMKVEYHFDAHKVVPIARTPEDHTLFASPRFRMIHKKV